MEQFNINWHSYNDHLREVMLNLMQSHELSDVTLVCEDKTKFKAHQFVLNACSPVFQSIINDLPQKDPVIYLRGVLAPEMNSILQFMYLGEATFYQERNVARTLEIKEISKDVDCDVPGSTQDKEFDIAPQPHTQKTYEKKPFEHINNMGDIEQIMTNGHGHFNEAGQYSCNKCDKKFSHKPGLSRHNKSAHEGAKYPCDDCGITFTLKDNLNRHKKKSHSLSRSSC